MRPCAHVSEIATAGANMARHVCNKITKCRFCAASSSACQQTFFGLKEFFRTHGASNDTPRWHLCRSQTGARQRPRCAALEKKYLSGHIPKLLAKLTYGTRLTGCARCRPAHRKVSYCRLICGLFAPGPALALACPAADRGRAGPLAIRAANPGVTIGGGRHSHNRQQDQRRASAYSRSQPG